jgi:RimJ/RimL family protein N-acetyltransferase
VLRGERVTLRATERADLPRLWELVEDLDVAVLAHGGPVVPTSLASYEARFDRHVADPPEDLIEFVIEVAGDVIGGCQLHAIDHFHRRCDLGIALGRDYWGKGFGQDAVRTLVGYAFTHLDMRRVGIRVLAHDARAIGAYAKVGFAEEGRLRAYSFFEGQPRDDLLMAILRDDASP